MENKSLQVPDYSVRRGKISAYGRALESSRRLQWLLVLFCGTVFLLLLALLTVQWLVLSTLFVTIITLAFVVVASGLWIICRYINAHLIEPNLAFRKWLQQVCDGNLDARIDLPEEHGHFRELDFHTRNLASALQNLSTDMETLVDSQTQKLNNQKRVLELLFKLTADVSGQIEDEAILVTVCQALSEWFQSARVMGYLLDENQSRLKIVASSESPADEEQMAVNKVVGKETALPSIADLPRSITYVDASDMQSPDSIQVPFFAGKQVAGFLVIELDDVSSIERGETDQVLTTVSEQLNLSFGRKIAQEQAHQSRMIRDRTMLAAEIHDSLAQTLLAIRYQTTLLRERLSDEATGDYYQDVLKIQGSIEEANEEVRGLIREYRTPLVDHRYADSLRVVIDQFSQSSGISVFFQSDDPQIRFTPREESVLQRIIGEALNNARKYADATMIRVYLQCDESGVRRVLVEDDGVGFRQNNVSGRAAPNAGAEGEHIGLSIMQDRALSIGANLTIDSEPGEGTRISIVMPPLIESRRETA